MSSPVDPCPICGKPKAAYFSPFCCKRCADIDLGRWLKGGYAIPGAPVPEPGKNPPEDDPDET